MLTLVSYRSGTLTPAAREQGRQAVRQSLCPRGTRILIFLTSTRDAMRDSSASQTDRSAQRSRAAFPTTPPRSARGSLPCAKERTQSVQPVSRTRGRSGQQVSCGAWSAKHSRSDTNGSLSGRAKHVTPADTSWHPKGVLRPRFAIKKRRFPPRPCSGIDSAVPAPRYDRDAAGR